MIYLFAGDDTDKKKKAYNNLLESIKDKGEFLEINHNSFDRMQIESLYSGEGLFTPQFIVVFNNILDREDNSIFILDKLPLMGESRSSFIFLENKIPKIVLDEFKKARAEMNIFELPKEKKEKFDNFLLANAFADRDKLNLWIFYRQAVDKDVGLEELVGVLFWKIKDMILKNNFSKFTKAELQNHAATLACILPEARSEGRDAETALEKFLLEVL